MIDLFDTILESKYFYKFLKIINPEIIKYEGQKSIDILISNNYPLEGIFDFIELFNIQKIKQLLIRIELVFYESKTIFGKGEIGDGKIDFIYVHIPHSFNNEKIVLESKKAIEYWIDNTDFKDDLANKFFKWWMQNYIFVQERNSNFLKSFDSAFVEWLRTISPEEAGDAYLKIINNSTDTRIKKRSSLGTKKIIDHINQGIEVFDIPIDKLKKGSNLLRRYD